MVRAARAVGNAGLKRQGPLPAPVICGMNSLARKQIGQPQAGADLESLRAILDRKYAQMRERAEAEWKRRHLESEPSDGCVRVRVR